MLSMRCCCLVGAFASLVDVLTGGFGGNSGVLLIKIPAASVFPTFSMGAATDDCFTQFAVSLWASAASTLSAASSSSSEDIASSRIARFFASSKKVLLLLHGNFFVEQKQFDLGLLLLHARAFAALAASRIFTTTVALPRTISDRFVDAYTDEMMPLTAHVACNHMQLDTTAVFPPLEVPANADIGFCCVFTVAAVITLTFGTTTAAAAAASTVFVGGVRGIPFFEEAYDFVGVRRDIIKPINNYCPVLPICNVRKKV